MFSLDFFLTVIAAYILDTYNHYLSPSGKTGKSFKEDKRTVEQTSTTTKS